MSDLVLLSGGMDSATALGAAAREDRAGAALAVDYGQRHVKELAAARTVADHYNVELIVLDFTSWGRLLVGSSLTDPAVKVPHGHYAAPSMAVTVVPNRNALLLMAAVGVADARGYGRVVTAVHAGDHTVYPDCRPEFIAAARVTAELATEGRVQIVAPFLDWSKAHIAELGGLLGVPYADTWSCYEGGERHCGRCGTCTERIEAFLAAGVFDPTSYQL